MTHASLFSGIGGFDLAAQWAGWDNIFNCEKDQFCQNILKNHFPNAIQYSDIQTTDFTIWRGHIDVLTGGFPCQPFSSAGKRLGTSDERNLWSEMLRAIREIQPKWIVGENVLGIINWSEGLVFNQVCADLETEGYQVTPYVLPVAGVGALHQRYRVWFIAHAQRLGLSASKIQRGAKPKEQVRHEYSMPTLETIKAYDFRSKSNKHGVIDGLPIGLDECSLHAYGNAIAPQLALLIFNAINLYQASGYDRNE